jgi:hypothetical protein
VRFRAFSLPAPARFPAAGHARFAGQQHRLCQETGQIALRVGSGVKGGSTEPSISPKNLNRPIRFDLSHARGTALYAFACGREVGIDVERIRSDFAGRRLPMGKPWPRSEFQRSKSEIPGLNLSSGVADKMICVPRQSRPRMTSVRQFRRVR